MRHCQLYTKLKRTARSCCTRSRMRTWLLGFTATLCVAMTMVSVWPGRDSIRQVSLYFIDKRLERSTDQLHEQHQQKQWRQDGVGVTDGNPRRHGNLSVLLTLRADWHRPQPLTPLLEQLRDIRIKIENIGIAGEACALPVSASDCRPGPQRTGNASSHQWSSPPENIQEKFKWQKVSPGDNDVYVFSAFFDRRWSPNPAVVIVGLAADRLRPTPKYCRIWYRDDVAGGSSHVTTTAHCRYDLDSHEARYTASFYTCFVRSDRAEPYAVSLVGDPCATSPPLNVLKVVTSSLSEATPSSSPAVNYTVCVSPLFYRYDDVRRLVEVVEVNRMFGAQHFVFYDYSSGPNVTRYLDQFYRKSLGVVTVVPWPLPMPANYWPQSPGEQEIPVQVHYFAQVAALNDCLYRSIAARSTFTVFTDLDEIIVPRRRDSWTALLNDVTSGWDVSRGSIPGVFLVQNTFFRPDWTPDQKYSADSGEYGKSLVLTATEREQKVSQWPMRSKYVILSSTVVMTAVHQASAATAAVAYVEESDALVHHYRTWRDDPVKPPARVVDRFMHRYADEIARRTAIVHRHMTTVTQR